MSEQSVFRWLLDVDNLWAAPFEGDNVFKSTERWAPQAQYPLSLLAADEKAKVLHFYRHSDAKLCLGSCLLKRRAISDRCGIPWNDVCIDQDSNSKPCYKPPNATGMTLEFNVSHHGTLVALVGCSKLDIKLGVDVVKMNRGRDYAKVQEDGFASWAKVYEMVFSEREVDDIAKYETPAELSYEQEIRAKLRHFYAHWCLKEAYVKMTGEALLAKWLKEMEFRNVQVPKAADDGKWGESCSGVEMWFRDQRLEGINMEIQAFQSDYMIATCASRADVKFTPFKELDIESDVYPFT